MKALTYKIAVLCLSALTTVSCSDFLQEDPKGQMTNLESFTEKSDLEGSIHALYYQVKMASGYIGIYAPVLMGDDMTSIISKSNFTDWDQFVSNDGNSMMTSGVGCWSCMWNVVKAANYIINGVAKTPGATADDINFAIAEARFWRAYAYFWMVRCWGPLPIIESFQLNVDATARSEEQVYDFLVKDLKFAETYLPTEYTTEPWNINGMNTIATRAAAQAALAQVYLTMAGWPLNKGTEYYKLAADKAKEVIDQVENGTYKYQLFDEFWKVYSRQYNKTNAEIILPVYFTKDFGVGDASQAARGLAELPEETGGFSDMRAEIKFWKEFPAGPRKKAIFGDVYYHNQDKKVVPWFYDNVTNCNNPYYVMFAFANEEVEYDQTKSYNEQADGWSEQTAAFIRLPEVYLWYAEAVGRSGSGDKTKAIELLNEVRRRADGKWNDPSYNYYPSTLSNEELSEAAYNEHGWEIAGYYKSMTTRYHDERRMNRLKDHFAYRLVNPEIEVTEQWLKENPDKADMVSGPVYMKERVTMTGSWDDSKMYAPYPSIDTSLYPSLKR